MERNEQEKEGGKAGDRIPDTPNTYISGIPKTPSEEGMLKEEDITPTLDDWIEALNQAAADTLEDIPANCKNIPEKINWEQN